MPRCPRCGNLVDELEALPAESLVDADSERVGGERNATHGRACDWCRHEVLEG